MGANVSPRRSGSKRCDRDSGPIDQQVNVNNTDRSWQHLPRIDELRWQLLLLMLRSSFLLATVPFVLACSGQTEGVKQPAWTTWKGSGVSLAHPVEWTADGSGAQGTTVAFMSPMDSGDVFRENVSLRLEETQEKDLHAYVGTSEQWITKELQKGVLIHSGATRNSTGELHQLEYTAEVSGLPVHCKQVVRLRGGKAYWLTFMAHADAWDEMLYIADAVMDSFKWVDK
jgi:hypothetical protein